VQNEQGALRIGIERAYAANIEVEVLKDIVLGSSNAEKTSRPVLSSTGCTLVQAVGVY